MHCQGTLSFKTKTEIDISRTISYIFCNGSSVLSSNYLKTLLTKTIVLSRNTLKNIVSNGNYTAKKLFKKISLARNTLKILFATKLFQKHFLSRNWQEWTHKVHNLPDNKKDKVSCLLKIKDVQRSPEDMTMMNHTAGVMGGRTFVANM